MARKKASWVGPVNPADPTTGVLRPTGELSSEARAESERTSPRPVVKPKDPKTKNTYKEPVQKRQKPKVKTVEALKAAEVRPATNAELGRGVTEVSTVAKPKRQRKPRTTTKTGKKIDPKTGKIRAPRKGQIAKVDGQVVRVTDENLEAATTAGRTTVLTPAGRDVVEGAAPLTPRPLQRTTTVRGGLRGPKGAAISHKEVADMVSQARGHLTQMTLTRSTPAYHEHHENFNLVHAQLEKHAPAAHQILGIMRHLTVNPTPQSAEHFELADKALGDTLSAYKAKSTHNVQSSRAGRAERIRRIKAERAGTTE
jgi:hypothetical protein